MSTVYLYRTLLIATLAVTANPSFAQSAEKAKSSASIAGKASPTKAVPAKATTERKRYEFTGAGAAAATQTTNSSAAQLAPSADKEKSGCHSSASDA